MLWTHRDEPARSDPLCPVADLLPMADLGGGYLPMANVPGTLRPYSAALAVAPIESGKHDTTASRWTEEKATERTDDGKVVPDSVPITHTDT